MKIYIVFSQVKNEDSTLEKVFYKLEDAMSYKNSLLSTDSIFYYVESYEVE